MAILHLLIAFMKRLIQSEELIIFAICLYFFPMFGLSWWWFIAICLYFFPMFGLSWWWFIAFILLPDIGMLGYLFSPRTGAYTYNLFHHKGVAASVFLAGLMFSSLPIQFAGFILFAHATLDRMLGYGLKYEKGFKYTHLGELA
jgi:hypothetical protein